MDILWRSAVAFICTSAVSKEDKHAPHRLSEWETIILKVLYLFYFVSAVFEMDKSYIKERKNWME